MILKIARRMVRRTVNVVLILIAIAVLIGYYTNRNRETLKVSCMHDVSAVSETELATIEDAINNGNVPILWKTDIPDNVSDMRIVEITFTLMNNGDKPAEMIHMSVEPLDGDIAVYTLTGADSDIPSKFTGTIALKLITTEPESALRHITLEYYVYGNKHMAYVEA